MAQMGLRAVETCEHRRQVESGRDPPQRQRRHRIADPPCGNRQRAGPTGFECEGQAHADGERVEVVGQPGQQSAAGVDRSGEVEVIGAGAQHHARAPADGDQHPDEQSPAHPACPPHRIFDSVGVETSTQDREPSRQERVERQLGGQRPALGDRTDRPLRVVDVHQQHIRGHLCQGAVSDGDQGDRQDRPVHRVDARQPAHPVAPQIGRGSRGQGASHERSTDQETRQHEEHGHAHIQPRKHLAQR